VTRANLENQQETLRLTRVRFELGRGSELDVSSALARLRATEAALPPLVFAERAAAHRLAVLLGVRPGALDSELMPTAEQRSTLTALAVGAPEDLLRRRPDVRAAERRLAAATARVGVATADLFPRVSLTGFLGFITGDADELGESASRGWSVTPAMTWAAFDLGSVRARLRAAEANADAELVSYELTVLLALEETENALVDYGQSQSRFAALVEQANASERAAELARIQYREGALDFLRLLDAERTVLEAQDTLAQSETDLNTSVVAIYKALGGGWEAAPSL
jgi:multidrug efflux system outer membrane protein